VLVEALLGRTKHGGGIRERAALTVVESGARAVALVPHPLTQAVKLFGVDLLRVALGERLDDTGHRCRIAHRRQLPSRAAQIRVSAPANVVVQRPARHAQNRTQPLDRLAHLVHGACPVVMASLEFIARRVEAAVKDAVESGRRRLPGREPKAAPFLTAASPGMAGVGRGAGRGQRTADPSDRPQRQL
jgi:hypothetical protein